MNKRLQDRLQRRFIQNTMKAALTTKWTKIHYPKSKTRIRSFTTSNESSDLDATIGFSRKMEQPCGGTVAGPYKKHLFICSGTKDWPNEISKWPGHYIETFTTQFRQKFGPKFSDIRITATDEPSKHQGRSFDMLVWPDKLKLCNITEANTPTVLEFLEKDFFRDKEEHAALHKMGIEHVYMHPDEKWVFVCSHQARDARCGYCGPILINKFKEAFANHPNIHVRACSHVGGHEYAGNVLVFPAADWFGYVTPKQVDDIANYLVNDIKLGNLYALGHNEVLQRMWRGNMTLSKTEQKSFCASWDIKFSEK